jgi:hypothetical protein
MRLPRWLVVSLLAVSVLAVPGAGAWWWVTWPERTANQFCAPGNAVMLEPTWTELVVGRRRFFIDYQELAAMGFVGVTYLAERGTVREPPY